jgi:putative membrane protein (TIGR04086 family)
MYCSGVSFLTKDVNKNNTIFFIFKSVIYFIVSTVLAMLIFSLFVYFAEIDKEYAPIFGTVSVAFGIFVTAYISSKTIGKKGYLYGFLIALCVFILNTLISMVLDDSGMTINTLFHLIIYVLSGVIGGVMGVNKKANTKYI